MAISTAYNFLNVSKNNFPFVKSQILKITAPDRIKFVEKLLFKTKTILDKRNLHTVFRVKYLKANPTTNSVKIYGDLLSFIGSKQATDIKKAYNIIFSYKGSTLFLHSFKEIKYIRNGEKEDE